jgi:hypothetical protein
MKDLLVLLGLKVFVGRQVPGANVENGVIKGQMDLRGHLV